ncbi:MAG: insulinase family protein [Erysipelotrichales bacterium]|nr:insulinase family protein [Erysipelotrichales bacterium]
MKKIKIAGVNEEIITEVMSNGLRVFLLPNNKVKNFYMTFSTQFGSKQTEFKIGSEKKVTKIPNGVAHFLEHLTFKVSEDIDATNLFIDLGSDVNAYTTFNHTCYEVFGFNKFKENLVTLLDFVQTPYYKAKDVEAEKGIICEEVKMYEDEVETELIFGMFRNLVHKDKIKNLVSGTTKDVNSTKLSDIETAYKTFYHPSNMFVTITGNFNPEEALAIIEENQNSRVFDKPQSITIKKERELNSVVKDYEEIERDIEIEKVNIGLKIPLSNFSQLKLDPKELKVYINLITNSMFGRSSKIKERLVSGNIITDGLYVSRMYLDKHLIITIMAETPYPKRYISLMKEEIKNITIDEEDLIRKKRVAISNLIRCFDDIEEVNNLIQSDILDYDEINLNLYDTYNNLNVKTAKRIATKLNNNATSILVIKKCDK